MTAIIKKSRKKKISTRAGIELGTYLCEILSLYRLSYRDNHKNFSFKLMYFTNKFKNN